jgi:hypothetical protein
MSILAFSFMRVRLVGLKSVYLDLPNRDSFFKETYLMLEIKLDAHIVDGKIEISEEQQKELTTIKNGSPVEVIVRTDQPVRQEITGKRDILQEMADSGYDSIIDFLMDYPLEIENFKPLTREEIYSGKRFE